MTVRFRRFYPGFNPDRFWLPLLRYVVQGNVEQTSSPRADLVVTSVFETRKEAWKRRITSRLAAPSLPNPPQRLSRRTKSVWFTGENIRPPVSDYDLTLSFDLDSFGGTNLYFPLILTELNWSEDGVVLGEQGINSRTGLPRMTPSQVAQDRWIDPSTRPKFACAFVGNPEPIRIRAIEALGAIQEVDVFGSAVGRPVESKVAIARSYRFMLCFENDLYPGYVTEKALEAYQTGCVPLWRGLDSSGILNPAAVVNAADFVSLREFVARVSMLNSSHVDMQRVTSQPLFSDRPHLDLVINRLRNLLDS